MPLILRTLRPDLCKVLQIRGRLFSSTIESTAFSETSSYDEQNAKAEHQVVPSTFGSRLQELYLETCRLAEHLTSATQYTTLPAAKKASSLYGFDCKQNVLPQVVDNNETQSHVASATSVDDCPEVSDKTIEWFNEHRNLLKNNMHTVHLHGNVHPKLYWSSYIDAHILDEIIQDTFSNPMEKAQMKEISNISTNSKANCDRDYVENGMASACNGDFYDDDVISRNSYEIDTVSYSKQHYLSSLVMDYPVQDSQAKSHLLCSTPQDSSQLNRMTSGSPQMQSSGKGSSDPNPQKPNMDQLRLMQDHLVDYMPSFFLKKHDYRIYTQDVVFENNMAEKSYTTRGLSSYVIEIAKLRVYGLVKYASVRCIVLNSTVNEVQGTVMVRWRVTGIPQVKAFMFWKFLPWKYFLKKNRGKTMEDESVWVDGLSTFHMDKDGLVCKHAIDKMVPDDEVATKQKKSIPAAIAKKLGLQPGVASSSS